MTSSKVLEKTSKYLSFILRHKPDSINLTLDVNGWANIEDLIDKVNTSGETNKLDHTLIQKVVETSDKKRFIISDDGQRIRASQGHSIDVDLQLTPMTPPEFLYHGTTVRFLDSILKEGLKPQQRKHVHLTTNTETAIAVGERYGKPIILQIKAFYMYNQGYTFYLSENNIWLTARVPIDFLILPPNLIKLNI